MKILAVCGNGLGSSLMIKMNISKVLKELGVEGVDVGNCDLASLTSTQADVVVVAKDLANSCKTDAHLIVLSNVMKKDELKAALEEYFANRN